MGNCVGVAQTCLQGRGSDGSTNTPAVPAVQPRELQPAKARACQDVEPVVVEELAVPSASSQNSDSSSRSSSSSSSSNSILANETLRHRPSGPSGSQYSLPLACYVLRKTRDVTDKYSIAEQIGFGQYGIVRVAVDKATGLRYAIKSISKTRAQQDHHDYCQRIRTEVEILYHLGGHSNIVQLYDVFEDAETIHLIMELCEGGDWFDQLLADGAFTEAQAARAVQSVLKTLTYCHSLEVAHRDVKPENLLYTSRGPHAEIKLADFGLSAMISTTGEHDNTVDMTGQAMRKVVGSAIYMAPEVLKSHGFNKERDIWSLGVVLYITLSGYPPYDGNDLHEVFDNILTQPLKFDDPSWKAISAEAKDFIARMLTKDPKQRASISALLAHPWMQGAAGEGDAERPPHTAGRHSALPDTVVTRLHQFAAMNRFKQEARKVLATFLPKEVVAGLRHIFQDMDADGDGLITLSELRSVLASKRLVLTDAQSEDMLRCADLNNNGVIDYEEFLAATINDMHLAKDELMLKVFKHFDHEGSGFITKQDLVAALSYQGLQVDLDSIIRDIDTDGDDLINYEEFCGCLRDQDQSCDNNLWPLLSASLSVRHSFMSSRSIKNRASLMSSLSAKRRFRTVHFKDSSFKNSLGSVHEGSAAVALPPSPCGVRAAPAAVVLPPSPCGAGAAPAAKSDPPSLPEVIQVRAAGRAAKLDLPSLPFSMASGGSGCLSIPAAPPAATRVKGDIETRLSSRRGSALMKSIMMDCEQMQEIMASLGSASAAGAKPRSTPGRLPGAGALGMLVRDAGRSPTKPTPERAGSGRLRARLSRASMSTAAAAAAEPVPPLLVLPPINVPTSSPKPSGSNQMAAPAQIIPTPPARPGRPSARSHPGATPPPSTPLSSPQLRPFSHAPCQQHTAPTSDSRSPASPRLSAVQPQGTPRGRSPGVRIRRSINSSLGRSLSRSRPSREASRGSSRAVSRGSSRGSSRAGSTRRSRRSSLRAVSRGSSTAVSRTPSGVSRAASGIVPRPAAPAADSSGQPSHAPSPHGPNISGAFSRCGSQRGLTGSGTYWRSSSNAQRLDSLQDLVPNQGGGCTALSSARLRADLQSSPSRSPTGLLRRMTSSRIARARNSSARVGGSQLLMASGSIGRPSSAMLASILTEWENEQQPSPTASHRVIEGP